MKKGIIKILIANIIGLVINLLTNFLLPKYLSVDAYSVIKTYSLYLSYAGFFSLGYNDGMYLKYGGKELNKIDENDLSNNFSNYILLILSMFVITFIFGFIIHDYIVIAFAFGIVSYNILGYLKSLYQATGEFDLYSKSLNFEKIAIFVLNMYLLFVISRDNGLYYILVQVLVGIIICIYLSIKLEKSIHFFKRFHISIKEYKENISSGFILMLGNFSSSIFTTLDRWFVKFFMSALDFALYSFAASMENLITLLITPITISLYNYFCKTIDKKNIKKVKEYIFVFGTIIISAAYPCKFILEKFLTEYIQASNIIFLLFSAQLFNVIIKGIYVNIYKSQKKQNKYLFQMIFMIIIGICLNILFYKLENDMVSFAIATLITSFIWFLICEFEKNNIYQYSISEYTAIILIIVLYIVTGYIFNSIIGFIIYCIGLLIIYIIFMKKTLIDCLNLLKSFRKKTKK